MRRVGRGVEDVCAVRKVEGKARMVARDEGSGDSKSMVRGSEGGARRRGFTMANHGQHGRTLSGLV